MNNLNLLENLKLELEFKRQKLNELVLSENDKELILKVSMELDNIINLYYLENIRYIQKVKIL